MYQLFLIFIILLSLFNFLPAKFESLEIGARPAGICAYTAVSNDGWAAAYNPAGLGQLQQRHFVLFYTNFYGLKDLSLIYTAYLHPFSFGCLGISAKQYGKADYYQEKQLTFSYGKFIFNTIAVGINIKYMAIYILPIYGSNWTWAVDPGILYRLSDKVKLGLTAKNISTGKIGKSSLSESINPEVSLGMVLLPNNNFTLSFDIYNYLDNFHLIGFKKELMQELKPELKIGQEIKLFKYLTIRTGLNTRLVRYSLGFGVSVNNIKFDFTYLSHSQLSGTNLYSLSYQF